MAEPIQHLGPDPLEDIRRAVALLEEVPVFRRPEYGVSRPAVERLLAEDIINTWLVPMLPGHDIVALARALFDAGWRPTIERLKRGTGE